MHSRYGVTAARPLNQYRGDVEDFPHLHVLQRVRAGSELACNLGSPTQVLANRMSSVCRKA